MRDVGEQVALFALLARERIGLGDHAVAEGFDLRRQLRQFVAGRAGFGEAKRGAGAGPGEGVEPAPQTLQAQRVERVDGAAGGERAGKCREGKPDIHGRIAFRHAAR